MKFYRKLLATTGLLALLMTTIIFSFRWPAPPTLPLAGQPPDHFGFPPVDHPITAHGQPPRSSFASASSPGVVTTQSGAKLASGVAAHVATAPIPIQAGPLPSALKNLPQTEQASLWAAFAAARRAVTPLNQHEAALPQNAGVRYFAANPGQQLTARFLDGAVRIESGRGGEWRGTLRFAGGTSSASPSERPAPVASEHRVEYRHHGGITEWYENRAEGIEHGFTVAQRAASPAKPGELRVDLQLDGLTAGPVVDDAGVTRSDVVRFHNLASGRPVVRYGKLKVWDATGHELDARLEAHDSSVAILVADAGATYPVTIDPLIVSEEAKLLPEFGDGAANDQFGFSVALYGDTAVIGSPYADGAFANQGSAYVFVRTGAAWSFQQKLLAGTPEANTEFGFSVAVAGDTAAVGALQGIGKPDRFRMKIWEEDTGVVVYDNQADNGDAAELNDRTILGGGSVVIHKSKKTPGRLPGGGGASRPLSGVCHFS